MINKINLNDNIDDIELLKCNKCDSLVLEDDIIDGMCIDCYDLEEIECSHCGCYETRDELTEGMCQNCYEEYLEDCKEYDNLYS